MTTSTNHNPSLFCLWLLLILSGFLLISCSKPVSKPVPPATTADIETAIKNHIDAKLKQGQGYFKLPFQGKELQLKLVRIHFEYLASLGPEKHFACVDLAGKDGEFYDVDFYLTGKPGQMRVTETMVHKINGRPLYLWQQQTDKTWARVPVDNASKELQGVKTGRDKFDFTYRTRLPKIKEKAEIWLPLPKTDSFQTVKLVSISTPANYRVIKDREHQNQIIYMTLAPEHSKKEIEMTFRVERKEKASYPGDKTEAQKYLKPERLVPVASTFKEIAEKAVKGKKTDLQKARALYDHVIDKMSYKKYGPGWGKGDAVFACDALYGNCTDFHSYFIALARAIGIPARFAIGASIPSARDDGGLSGYHCWAEFYADGKWWPVDISEADKYTALSIYYFGHQPANRIEFSQGRDLEVTPSPSFGPINFLAYPILEVDGKLVNAAKAFTFKRIKK